ncbi:MAG: hypothetical protein FJ117_02170 [Deltaproteobacteria bacterium]|nr:hypothetical protein [Deltaproteobacteria bacterium]
MLIIRREQWDVLSRYMVHQFEDDVVKHLQRKFPQKTEGMPDGELRLLIQAGTENAQRYGITIEADVVRYLECMMTYGVEFDTDPSASWAGEILNDPELLGREKTKLLIQHLEKDSEGKT